MDIIDTDVGTVRLRQGDARDAAQLAELGERTFRETFAADNSADDMDAHVAGKFGAAVQARELADPSVTFLVAEADDRLVAYALVRAGPAPACVGASRAVEVERFYVDRPWHGTGVANTLMSACAAEAAHRGADTLWLAVWERNARAIRFYARHGFRDVGAQHFVLGSDVQDDRVMAKTLARDERS